MQNATEAVMNGEDSLTSFLADLPPPADIEHIACDTIHASPTQPRRTFRGIEELSTEIVQHGLLHPLTLRKHPTIEGHYELVCGERRLRAIRHANYAFAPAIVRTLTDAEVIEIQLVENAQRDDIHPLDEADAYQALHEKYQFSVEEIAAKVSKPVSTIYARLKYCALCPEARKAFLADELSATVALMLARIPDAKLQKEALKEVGRNYRGDQTGARAASEIIQRRFMLRLVDAPFDRADASLVPTAGACTSCEKRTGNQRELFSDVEKKDDLCSDPPCFKSKQDAEWKRRVDAAPEKKQEVLSAKASKQVFYEQGHLKHDAGFVDLNARTYADGSEKTNAHLLSKAKAELPVIIARDPAGGIHELVDASAFKKATQKAEKEPKKTAAEVKRDEEFDAQARAADRERAKREKSIVAIVAAAERRKPNDALWRAIAIGVAALYYDVKDVFTGRGHVFDESKPNLDQVVAAVSTMKEAQVRSLVVELLLRCTLDRDVVLRFEGILGAGKKAKR